MTVSQTAPVAPPRPRVSADDLAVALPVAAGVAGVTILAVAGVAGLGQLPHLTMLVAMTLAMMSPYALPLARAVARATLWWQAPRAVVVAIVTFLVLWCAVAGGLHLIGELVSMVATGTGAIAALALVCAADQLGRRRTALLRACQVTRPVRPTRPIRGSSRWAAVAATRCVRICAVPMTLMAIEPTAVGFVAITAMLWLERFAERSQLRFALAAGYLLVGAVLIVVAAPSPGTTPMPLPMPMHQHG